MQKEPAGQGRQALELVAPGCGLKVPAGQAVHDAWPEAGWNEPVRQLEQAADDPTDQKA